MKIIQVDNFARETVAEILVAANISQERADMMLKRLRARCHPWGPVWYESVPDDHVLWGGMAELV